MTLTEIENALLLLMKVITEEQEKVNILLIQNRFNKSIKFLGNLYSDSNQITYFFQNKGIKDNASKIADYLAGLQDFTQPQPKCGYFIKDHNEYWENRDEFPYKELSYQKLNMVEGCSDDIKSVADNPIPLRDLLEDQNNPAFVNIDANDIRIYLDYTVQPVLDYLTDIGLVKAEEIVSDSAAHEQAEPESDDDSSNSSVGDANSDEEQYVTVNVTDESSTNLQVASSEKSNKQYVYRIILAELDRVSAGLTLGICEQYKKSFCQNINNALLKYYEPFLSPFNKIPTLQNLPLVNAATTEVINDEEVSENNLQAEGSGRRMNKF